MVNKSRCVCIVLVMLIVASSLCVQPKHNLQKKMNNGRLNIGARSYKCKGGQL